jgi:hypothetical protein
VCQAGPLFMTGVEPPDRADSHLHLLLATQPRADFIECQIRLLGNEFEQPLLVLPLSGK